MPMLIEPGQKYYEHIENKDVNYMQLPYEIREEEKLYELKNKL